MRCGWQRYARRSTFARDSASRASRGHPALRGWPKLTGQALDAAAVRPQRAAVPTRIDLLRHGLAHSSHPDGDAARTLAPQGVSAVRALGGHLGRLGWRPERVLTSPYARARETASLVLDAAGVTAGIRVLKELEPERDPTTTALAVGAELGQARHVLLVGHQPLLGLLVEFWTGDSVPLSPAEFLSIEFDGVPGAHSGRVVTRLAPR